LTGRAVSLENERQVALPCPEMGTRRFFVALGAGSEARCLVR
jgi:hypothetical protein